ncbi:MAG: YdeI/OmpD-associated family protein [Opitutales bacterium]|jgi:uncharacterized protein YdeI (YjbR/CyaY-like superfamily)
MSELELLLCANAKTWEDWLGMSHATAPGVWLKIAKKGAGVASVSQPEAIEVALCHGWIDGQVKRHDAAFYLVRFTPRRPKSIWSQINCAKVEKLIEAGRMRAPGLAAVKQAKADGRWAAAYPAQSRAEVPADLRKALAKNRVARKFFATLDSQNRFAVLFRIHTAKKAETRKARIEKFVAMLAEGKKPHP